MGVGDACGRGHWGLRWSSLFGSRPTGILKKGTTSGEPLESSLNIAIGCRQSEGQSESKNALDIVSKTQRTTTGTGRRRSVKYTDHEQGFHPLISRAQPKRWPQMRGDYC
eukprot:8975756-Pyramimonas_sp.AAC.1